MPVLIATRGPKTGQCNICGCRGKLTEDHTPPKGCIRVGEVEIRHIVERLEMSTQKGRRSQNGVKYRTLCSRCNNSLLGIEYDPSFINFVNDIATILRSPLTLPKSISVRAKPQRVMRALLGHVAAQGVDRYLKGGITEPLRDYFLQTSLPLPNQIEVYCWPFPYNEHIMARDCAYSDLRKSGPVAIWVLKFFPVSFLVAIDKPVDYSFPGIELSQWRGEGIDDEHEVPIALENIPHPKWPELPTDHSFAMYGQEAIVSFPVQRTSR